MSGLKMAQSREVHAGQIHQTAATTPCHPHLLVLKLLFWTAIVRCLLTPSIVSLAAWFGPPGILANCTLTFTASLGSFKYVTIGKLTSDLVPCSSPASYYRPASRNY
jgi:hypothetical protein